MRVCNLGLLMPSPLTACTSTFRMEDVRFTTRLLKRVFFFLVEVIAPDSAVLILIPAAAAGPAQINQSWSELGGAADSTD